MFTYTLKKNPRLSHTGTSDSFSVLCERSAQIEDDRGFSALFKGDWDLEHAVVPGEGFGTAGFHADTAVFALIDRRQSQLRAVRAQFPVSVSPHRVAFAYAYVGYVQFVDLTGFTPFVLFIDILEKNITGTDDLRPDFTLTFCLIQVTFFVQRLIGKAGRRIRRSFRGFGRGLRRLGCCFGGFRCGFRRLC